MTLKERLSRRLQETDLIDDEIRVRVMASFGVATFPQAGETVDALIQRADVDMYADKNMRKAERDRATAKVS
jgi:predicted signal transduction protein with EAL and GGDEF domain